MESVGIRALQQHATAVVRRAAAGEVVEVTDRGRPVAQLGPVRRDGLAALEAAGLLVPARRSLRELPPPLPAAGTWPHTLGQLLDDARGAER